MQTLAAALLSLLLIMSVPASAGDATRVSWATATKGGGFQLFGQHVADVINATDDRLDVDVLATNGSRHNLRLLESGDVDVGQVEGNAARVALDGIGRPAAPLKVLSVMYPNPGMFVVRGDSRYRRIEDLKGQAIAFGTKASGLRILVNDVLDGLSLTPDRDFKQIILDKAADGPRLVIDGDAEALWGAGIGWPGFVSVADGPTGGRFIPPSQEQIRRILQRHPHLQRMTVPAGTYRGQTEDIPSIGLWSLILVRPDLDETVVYRLARALDRGHAALADRLPQGRYTRAANTVEYVPVERLHPGAARYYTEIGLLPASAGIGDVNAECGQGHADNPAQTSERCADNHEPEDNQARTASDDRPDGQVAAMTATYLHARHAATRQIFRPIKPSARPRD